MLKSNQIVKLEIQMIEEPGNLQIELQDSTSVEVSAQTYQAIHKLITGRSDTITQFYEQPFLVDLEELIQLDKKIHQVCGQYKKISITKTVTVNHRNDSKAELVNLNLYDQTNNNPTESVILKYNIIICPANVAPSLNKPQSYTISIRFFSGIVIKQRLQKVHKKMPLFISLINTPPAVVKIEYIDYLIAKNLFHTIDDCIKGFKVTHMSNFRKASMKYSTILCVLMKYIMPVTIVILLLIYSPAYIASYKTPLLGLSKLIFWGFASFFFTYRIGQYVSRKLDIKLSTLEKSSFIKMNKGDERVLEESKKEDRKTINNIIMDFIGSCLLSVITSITTYFHF